MVAIARITISDTAAPTPYIDPTTGEWMVYDATKRAYVSTGIRAQGDKGEKGEKGDKGDGLEVIDTRNDNQPPSWYRSKYALTTVREFKNQTKIGIPSGWKSGTYCTLETTVRWGDSSGGRVEQSTTLDNGTQLRRVGTADDTAWEPWINVSAQVKAVEQGLSSAKTTIAALEKAKEEIEKGKLSADDLPAHLKWIYDAFNEGKTDSKGGLTLTQIIGLANILGEVTAYISGRNAPGAHMLAAGVSSLDDQNAVSYINYDGSAKFGELEIDKNGWVMISNVGRNKRLDVTHITSDAVCFEDHTGGRWRSTKAHIGMSADGDAMEIIVDGGTAITLSKKGVHVNSFDDRLMPRVLAHGKFDKSGRLSRAIAYNAPNTSGVDSRFSCSRVSEGKYRLTFPGEWLNPWSTLVFQGTEQDSQSGQSARFVSFGPATRYGGSAYVYVFGADDNSLEDVAVYFQIIAI